jgi:hypothetical protein
MFVPIQNSNSFAVFYMGTDPNDPKPGQQRLELHGKGIKLGLFKKRLIRGDSITKTEVGYEVKQRSLSAGGAVAGGILAGGIGAVAGAAMGGKKVEPHVTITYKDDSGSEQQIVLIAKLADKIKKQLDKKYLS